MSRNEKGQAVVEFALIFPLQILVTLLILQISFLYVAEQVVNYAAFAAARAELVGEDAEQAAEAICTPIAGITDLGTGVEPIYYPGWGDLDRSDISRERTYLEDDDDDDDDMVTALADGEPYVEVMVKCNVELIFPVANKIVWWVWQGPEEEKPKKVWEIDEYDVPYVAVSASHRIPVPWRK